MTIQKYNYTFSTYVLWKQMRSRCNRKAHQFYKDYGGRGIYICDRWNVFANFYADMGDRPKGMTLDRIDNNGPYSPENCKWSTRSEQCLNRRDNRKITFNGETLCIVEWGRKTGLHETLLRYRIKKWGVEKALTTPKHPRTEIIRNVFGKIVTTKSIVAAGYCL